MGGTQDAGVFGTMEAAQARITERNIGGNLEIIERPVIGTPVEAGIVFTAARLDSSHDIHNFEGVYGGHEQAKEAAGDHGLVMRCKI